jgi:general secretion pathway protein E
MTEAADPLELAKSLGVPFSSELEDVDIHLESLEKIGYGLAMKWLALPIEEGEDWIRVAVATPVDFKVQEQIFWRTGKRVEPLVVPENLLKEKIQKVFQSRQAQEDPKPQLKTDESQEAVSEIDLLESTSGGTVADLVNRIFKDAIAHSASDIHLEPAADSLVIRFRIDGMLQTRNYEMQGMEAALLTRIKVLAQMDIAERRLPQDGRIKVLYSRREIDFRVSSVPVVHGERLVLRVLDKGGVVLNLGEIEMPERLVQDLRDLSKMTEGILLVTGPTGSGKTTTLYSILSELPLDQINVMTVEDPVEYKLDHVAQIGVKPAIGLTFAKGLRHILRQDPDVILIGEIRDLETAQIAIQASLTGHLVLSTLHTNDSVSAVTRLYDMGIEPYLISSSLVGVLAQRLARRICKRCKESYMASESECQELGLTSGITVYRGRGCVHCFGSGYRGRVGVYELFRLNSKIRSHISHQMNLEELRHLAMDAGMMPLRQAALDLALAGKTTTAEVLRITRGMEE